MHCGMLEHAQPLLTRTCMFLQYVVTAAPWITGAFDGLWPGFEVSEFLPVPDMAFLMEVTVAEVSKLPPDVLPLI